MYANINFEKNAERFMTPEQVRGDYLELSLDAIKASTDITEEQLLDRYEQTKAAFTSTEYRSASHILLTLDEDASADDSDAKRQQLVNMSWREKRC